MLDKSNHLDYYGQKKGNRQLSTGSDRLSQTKPQKEGQLTNDIK
ncbi:hypothetical protein [Crocosphaera sp. Alani8]